MNCLGSRYTVGEQPCENFRRSDADVAALGAGNGMDCHQCPICEGNRAHCINCNIDHHDNGWESCKPGAYAGAERCQPLKARTL